MEVSLRNRPMIRDSYRETLETTFDHYLKDKAKDQPTRVLSVGCNLGYEAGALLRIFPTAQYVGVDINEDIISGAKATNYDLGRVEFRVGDAREEKTFGNEPWDVIVIRHPQVLGSIMEEGNSVQDWYLIINNSIKFLKKDGLLFVSASSMQERNRVVNYISLSKEMQIIVNSENEFRKSVGTFNDDFIILSRKTKNNLIDK